MSILNRWSVAFPHPCYCVSFRFFVEENQTNNKIKPRVHTYSTNTTVVRVCAQYANVVVGNAIWSSGDVDLLCAKTFLIFQQLDVSCNSNNTIALADALPSPHQHQYSLRKPWGPNVAPPNVLVLFQTRNVFMIVVHAIVWRRTETNRV